MASPRKRLLLAGQMPGADAANQSCESVDEDFDLQLQEKSSSVSSHDDSIDKLNDSISKVVDETSQNQMTDDTSFIASTYVCDSQSLSSKWSTPFKDGSFPNVSESPISKQYESSGSFSFECEDYSPERRVVDIFTKVAPNHDTQKMSRKLDFSQSLSELEENPESPDENIDLQLFQEHSLDNLDTTSDYNTSSNQDSVDELNASIAKAVDETSQNQHVSFNSLAAVPPPISEAFTEDSVDKLNSSIMKVVDKSSPNKHLLNFNSSITTFSDLQFVAMLKKDDDLSFSNQPTYGSEQLVNSFESSQSLQSDTDHQREFNVDDITSINASVVTEHLWLQENLSKADEFCINTAANETTENETSVISDVSSMCNLALDVNTAVLDGEVLNDSFDDPGSAQDYDEELQSSQSSCHGEDCVDCDEELQSLQSSSHEEDSHVKHRLKIAEAIQFNNVKLHGHTNVTVNEAILNVLKLYLENLDSKAGLQRSISTICKLLPKNHNLPSSSYKILTYVKNLAPPVLAVAHYYCRHCSNYIGTEMYNGCNVCVDLPSDIGHFYNFDIGTSLKYLFECRNLASAMDETDKDNASPHTTYKDVRDGSVYIALNTNRGKYVVNLALNFDGVKVRKTTDKELWLVLCAPLEVPLHVRESFIFVAALWYDKVKPNMNTLLRPFSERIAQLDTQGVVWSHPQSSEIHSSCVKVPVIIADAPARAKAQNVLYFNGKYGCNMCEVKTVLTARVPGLRRIRVYPYVENPVLRNKLTMLNQAIEAQERDTIVKGVKGPSVLSLIPSLDISVCFIPEYMHGVLLGVEKHLLNIWTVADENWSIKRQIPDIDRFLSNVPHPDFIHRLTRALKSLKFWKASDFYYFLLFESVPVLHNRLPEQYFNHYLLLVKGIYLLLKGSISENDIDEAELLLKLFVCQFPELYTERKVTYYIHQLCHLGLCVRRYGPLFATSAFSFENLNGIIADATHGTNNVSEEIVSNISVAQGIQMLTNIGKDGHALFVSSFCNGEVLGKPSNVHLTPDELEYFSGKTPYFFARAKIGYTVYTSETYKKLRSENFHVLWKVNGEVKYGTIKYFAKLQDKLLVCLKTYEIDNLNIFFHRETRRSIVHIIPVRFELSEDVTIFEVATISKHLEKVGRVGSYLFRRPNLYQQVM